MKTETENQPGAGSKERGGEVASVVAYINARVRSCRAAARNRPEQAECHLHAAQILTALAGDIEQGLHHDEQGATA